MLSFALQAQELNAKVTVNTQKLQSPNEDLFKTLQNDINQMLNENRWTDLNFMKKERIDCVITLTINEMNSEGSVKGDLQISTRRPVYNSTYVTPMLSYRDNQIEFNYILGQSLNINLNNITDNLVAIMAFYAYIMVGLDCDSFSPGGGRPYFSKALDIANAAQMLDAKGWEPFSGSNSRYDLALALSDDSYKGFHTMWYDYHRLGLDEMAENPSRGRIKIIESTAELMKLYENRPSSPLLTIYGATKLEELVSIASQAKADEKKDLKKLLLQIYPTRNNIINRLN